MVLNNTYNNVARDHEFFIWGAWGPHQSLLSPSNYGKLGAWIKIKSMTTINHLQNLQNPFQENMVVLGVSWQCTRKCDTKFLAMCEIDLWEGTPLQNENNHLELCWVQFQGFDEAPGAPVCDSGMWGLVG